MATRKVSRIYARRRKSKLTQDDKDILARVMKDQGTGKTASWLSVLCGAIPYEEINWRHRKFPPSLGALQFLRELFQDYSARAVYNAFDEIEPEYLAHRLGLVA
jgi:hypothetical protein